MKMVNCFSGFCFTSERRRGVGWGWVGGGWIRRSLPSVQSILVLQLSSMRPQMVVMHCAACRWLTRARVSCFWVFWILRVPYNGFEDLFWVFGVRLTECCMFLISIWLHCLLLIVVFPVLKMLPSTVYHIAATFTHAEGLSIPWGNICPARYLSINYSDFSLRFTL